MSMADSLTEVDYRVSTNNTPESDDVSSNAALPASPVALGGTGSLTPPDGAVRGTLRRAPSGNLLTELNEGLSEGTIPAVQVYRYCTKVVEDSIRSRRRRLPGVAL